MWMRRLCLALVLNALVLNTALWLLAPAGTKETVLQHTRAVLLAEPVDDDSWGVMGQAVDYLRTQPPTSVYAELFFHRQQKFQYPVTSLIPFALVRNHVTLVSWAFFVIDIVALWALFEIVWTRMAPDVRVGRSALARGALVAAFALTFYPAVKAYTIGQIQVWLNALFTLSVLCWLLRYRAAAGVLIGAIALVKPHYGVFLVWAAVRREWTFAAAGLIVASIGLTASLAMFGWSNHIDYLRVLSFLTQHGESFYPNQSVNGLLNRLAGLAHPELYDNVRSDLFLPPYNPWVYAGTLVATVVFLGCALWNRRADRRSGVVDFCIMGLSCTIASPIAWEHHYGILLPIFVVLLATAVGSRTRLLWLMVSYVLTSNYLQVTNLLASTVLNVLQSYLFAGALIALLLLYRARASSPSRGEEIGVGPFELGGHARP